MTKISFILQLSKGVATLCVAGFVVFEIRDVLLANFGISIPDFLYQILVLIFLYGALQLGSGKFMAQLKEDYEKQKKPNKEC